MVHKIEGAELLRHVVVADHPVPADVAVVAQPGGQAHQGVVAGLGELARGVGVADLNGEGVVVALVGGGGLLVQGDALDDLPLQADEEVGAHLRLRLVIEVVVLLGGGARIAGVVDGDIGDPFDLLPPAAGAVDGDDLLVHPIGGSVPGQLGHLVSPGEVDHDAYNHHQGQDGDQDADEIGLLPFSPPLGRLAAGRCPFGGRVGAGGCGGRHNRASFAVEGGGL